MKKGKMKKAIASIAIALVLSLTATVTTASAAGKKESLYFDGLTISNVTSTSKGLPEECKEATDNDGYSIYDYLEAEWDFDWDAATVYYCDAPATLALSDVAVTGVESLSRVTIDGIDWWWWEGDSLTQNVQSHVEELIFPTTKTYTEHEYFTGDITITEPGTYLFVPYIVGHYAGGIIGEIDAFCVIVSGSSKPTTPAPSATVTPVPTATTPAPSKTVAGNTATLKTTAGLVKTIPANPTKGQDLTYKVQKGEKLFTIAYNYYGSMQKSVVDRIYQANAAYFKSTNGVLKAGAVLTLPAKGLITPVTQSSLDKAAGMYLVKSGDTLADIAKTYYGDGNQWKKIYEANKDRVKMVGKSPMIYEGQWLVIPE